MAPISIGCTLRPDQRRVASDNREELDRSKAALKAAAAGEQVCVVSGGDPGVFAMAAAVCEAIEDGPQIWRHIDLVMVPGVTAMLAVAARAGAPLGHDFCAISLSDNLKPWTVIEQRLRAVADCRAGDRALQSHQPQPPLAIGHRLRHPARSAALDHSGHFRPRRRPPGRAHHRRHPRRSRCQPCRYGHLRHHRLGRNPRHRAPRPHADHLFAPFDRPPK